MSAIITEGSESWIYSHNVPMYVRGGGLGTRLALAVHAVQRNLETAFCKPHKPRLH